MKSSSTIALCAWVAFSNTVNAITCKSGAHIVVARESDAPPGFGYMNLTTEEVLKRIPDSDAVAVDYPASRTGPITYFQSVPYGVGNMTQLVYEYVDACPGRKVVLMGYSQGAQVVGDVLLGNNNSFFPPITTGLNGSYLASVAAVVIMGDVTNVAGQPFLVGNSTRNGTFPRDNYALWASKSLVNKTASYCDANDTYCDSGSGNYSHVVHNRYREEYGLAAADFVVEKFAYYNSTTSNGTAGTTGGSATTTAATTSGSGAPTSSSSRGASSTSAGTAATTSATRPNDGAYLAVPVSVGMIAAYAIAFGIIL